MKKEGRWAMQNKSVVIKDKNKRKTKVFVLLTVTLIMLTGCASSTHYQWKNTGDKGKFRRDSAQCKLMARNAGNNVHGYNNQSYQISNYDYGSGYSTSTIEPEPLAEIIGAALTGMQQDTETRETYELCMQSRGYQQIKTISGQLATGLGGHCMDSIQCPDKMLCDEVAGKCISSIDWVRKYDKNRKQGHHRQKSCENAVPCPKTEVHDGPECTCISMDQWVLKYSKLG